MPEVRRRRADTPQGDEGKMAGRFFYGCNRYPDCDYVAWKKPGKEENAQNAGETEAADDAGDM